MHWKDLEVWKKSHDLVLKVYEVSKTFPKNEVYALTDQIRRASMSVPANIVEGQSRNTTKEHIQFLYNARGSLEEIRYFLLLSKDLGYMNKDTFQSLEGDITPAIKQSKKMVLKNWTLAFAGVTDYV
jgi:four helix bundle protein